MHSSFAIASAFLALAFGAPTQEKRQAETFTGEMTFYAPGLGSCGITSSDAEAVVALSKDRMTGGGANPNANPLCGQTITITFNGVSEKATVVDTCQSCAPNDIDVSSTVFTKVAPNGDGRVPGVSWSFDAPQ